MKSLPTSLLLPIARVAACWLVCCVASAQLRIVSWNTNGGARDGTGAVLEAIGLEEVNGIAKPIDVLSLQEQGGGDTSSILAALNGLYGTGVYAAAPVPSNAQSSGAGLPGLIYNTQTVDLLETVAFGSVNTSAQARSTLRYKLKPELYGDNAAFYVYGNHYKASQGSSNEARRLVEANAIRSDLDAMGDGISAVLSGDLNTYDSFEPGYQALLAPGAGQAFDPIDSPGNWHDNSAFRSIHTQSPATLSQFPGQVTGGIDDRFDFQLVTGELLDTEGVDLIPGSYRVFGNNGTHQLNGSIGTGTGAAADVLAALETASDHLPVVADYQVPARMGFSIVKHGSHRIPVSVGFPYPLSLTLRNFIDGHEPIGVDELDYELEIIGDTEQAGEIITNPVAPGLSYTHQVWFDTTAPGDKQIDLYFAATSDGAAQSGVGEAVPQHVSFTLQVDFPGDYNEDGVVDSADYSVWRDHVGHDISALPNALFVGDGLTIGDREYGIWRSNYGRRLSDIVGVAAAVPEPAAIALLLLGSLATGWRRR